MQDINVRFSTHIRPLFRDKDIEAMIKTRKIDLSDYEQVKARANDILDRLEMGDMPCDGAWPQKQIELFKEWIAEGTLP